MQPAKRLKESYVEKLIKFIEIGSSYTLLHHADEWSFGNRYFNKISNTCQIVAASRIFSSVVQRRSLGKMITLETVLNKINK